MKHLRPTAYLRAQKAKLSHTLGRAEGAQPSKRWGLREARSSGQQEVPRTSPRSSVLVLLCFLLSILCCKRTVPELVPHHILLMAEGILPPLIRNLEQTWTKRSFAVAKKPWSRISLKWKCTRKAALHNTLCSVGALISFCWLEVGRYAGFLVAKMQRPYSFLADIVLG